MSRFRQTPGMTHELRRVSIPLAFNSEMHLTGTLLCHRILALLIKATTPHWRRIRFRRDNPDSLKINWSKLMVTSWTTSYKVSRISLILCSQLGRALDCKSVMSKSLVVPRVQTWKTSSIPVVAKQRSSQSQIRTVNLIISEWCSSNDGRQSSERWSPIRARC